jgi:hypothetical protein
MFGPLSLAYWIMEDGYYDGHGRSNCTLLCTECYTKAEYQLLIQVLAQ